MFIYQKNFLTYKNSVFTFEAATDSENSEDDTDNDFGNREFPISERGILIERVMNILIQLALQCLEICHLSIQKNTILSLWKDCILVISTGILNQDWSFQERKQKKQMVY